MRAFLIVSSAVFLFTSVEADPVPPTHCFRWNEVMKCVDTCPPERTCETRDAQYKCLVQDDSKCETKCVCKDGFYRTPRGDCISNEHCDQCSGPHEYFACDSECDNVCATLHEQNQTNCPIVNFKCNEKCYCEEGHARDAGNVCVPIADCHQCSGPHEYFTCGSACDNVCSTLHEQNQTNCPIVNIKCNEKCYCEEGHARDAGNVCVPIAECHQCSGPHEYFACGSACDNVCATLHEQNQTNCPIVNGICNPKCYCQEGHARDAGNVCVPIEDCPKFQENAHNAEDRNSTRKAQRNAKARNRRDETNTTITDQSCSENETMDVCKKSCPPETCSSLVARYACQPEPCHAACACRAGYLRTQEGAPCLPLRECPQLG